MFSKYLLSIFVVMFVVMACKEDNNDKPTPENTDTITSSIVIDFFNSNPLVVDLNSDIPTLDGEITSDLPISNYKVYLYTDGTQSKINDTNLSDNITEFQFNIDVPFQVESDSIVLVATNNKEQKNTASIKLQVTKEDPVDPIGTTDKDAFPGAEGHGRHTTGGRGGKVLFVDNLKDDTNEGSLRWAVNQTGARIIVFRVSGTIELNSTLNISNGNLTIAGQSAPGDGICIAKNNLRLSDGLDNVIIRYLRFRNAHGSDEYDAAWGRNCSNIIIDHCSFSWGNDEVASFYDNTNFTMQWCMITESFYHSTHPKGDHGYGGIWGGMSASFHHNLIAHHTSRNPRFCGARYHTDTRDLEIVDFRNNVLYNWGFNSAYGGEFGQHNIVNNYYKAGPATSDSKKNRIVEISDADSKWYVDGNYVDGYAAISADNWSGGVQGASSSTSVRATTEFDKGTINTQSAEQAYADVLAKVGASLVRDAIDARIVTEVENGTTTYSGTYGPGIIDSEQDVGGFPLLSTYNQITDADNDGMDDAWETQNGLDPSNSDDHSLYTVNDNYTNIEVYLNSLLD